VMAISAETSAMRINVPFAMSRCPFVELISAWWWW
jgi:hypothetical protein